MDFSLTDEQQAIADLSTQLLADQATPTRIKELEDDRRAGLRPRAVGQAGRRQPAGRGHPRGPGRPGLRPGRAGPAARAGRAAPWPPSPLLATLAYGAAPIAQFGTDAAARRPAARRGRPATTVLTAALVEPLGDPLRPDHHRQPADDGGWVLDGSKTCVPAGLVADRVLVSATTPDGRVGLFVVDPTRRRRRPPAPGHHHPHPRGPARARPACTWAPTPWSDRSTREATTRVVADRARHRGHLLGHDRGGRGRAAPDRRLHHHPRAVRPAHRHLPGRRASGRPTPSSTPRRSASPP